MHLDKAALALALSALACGPGSREVSEASASEVSPRPRLELTSEQTKAVLPPRQPPAPLSRGRLWASVRGVGVYVIDAEGWRELHIPTQTVEDMRRGDAGLLVLTREGVSVVGDDGQAAPLGPVDEQLAAQLGMPKALALSHTEGTPWIVAERGLARWQDKWERAALEGDFDQLELDADGRAWFAGEELRRAEPDALAQHGPVELPDAEGKILLASSEGGTVLAALYGCRGQAPSEQDCQLAKLGSEPLRPRSLVLPCAPAQLALSPDGAEAHIATGCGLVQVALAGEAEPQVAREGWDDQVPLALAVASSGRRWLGTHEGLRMVDTRGVSFDFPLAQLGPMAGAVTQVLVEGEGPVPPELDPPRRGGLEGRLVRASDGAPLGGAKVQLCSRLAPTTTSTSSPCVRVGLGLETRADDQGRFELAKVPLSHYLLGVEYEGQWTLVRAELLTMRHSLTSELGELKVELLSSKL